MSNFDKRRSAARAWFRGCVCLRLCGGYECVCVYLHEKNRETHSNCRTQNLEFLFAHIVEREIIYPHHAMAVRLIRKIVRILFSKPVRAIFPILCYFGLLSKSAHSNFLHFFFKFRVGFSRRTQNSALIFSRLEFFFYVDYGREKNCS